MSQDRQRPLARKTVRGVDETPSHSRSLSRKRNPSSPVEENEPKKQFLADQSPEKKGQNTRSPRDIQISDDVTLNDDTADKEQRAPVSHITLKREDLDHIAECLKSAFRNEMKDIIKNCVGEAVEEVLCGFNARMNALESKNLYLEQENEELEEKVARLEEKCDQNEQYSRRNCLRISGVPESEESTDDYILKVCSSLSVPITLGDIDRSHRLGRKDLSGRKPRAVIVKFATYRARQLFFKSRFSLKSSGYEHVFVNEDLTKRRNSVLYNARGLVKGGRINKAWSSDGQILVKDKNEKIIPIHREEDLRDFV